MKIIYAIVFPNSIETSFDINEIEKKAKLYAKQKKEAIITKNGVSIGWIGEDLTNIKGWSWYIQN